MSTAAAPVDKNGAATPVLPKKKKSSVAGDAMFVAFLAVFASAMYASFQKRIPWQKWELYSIDDHMEWAKYMGQNGWIPVALSILYVVLVFGVEDIMKRNEKDKGYDLRKPLAFWSLLLTVFSFVGALRTVPMVYEIVTKHGIFHLVCGDTRYEWLSNNPAGYWTLLFCLSKIPELLDTAFIVLRKRPVITLHWYHHFTVMLFCWQSWATCCLNGLIYAAMNLSVHTVMYMFYALTALGYRPTTFAQSITLGQITQMVVGTSVTAYVCMDKLVWHPVGLDSIRWKMEIPAFMDIRQPIPDADNECRINTTNALAGFFMYGSYLVLFLHFYYTSYVVKGGGGDA